MTRVHWFHIFVARGSTRAFSANGMTVCACFVDVIFDGRDEIEAMTSSKADTSILSTALLAASRVKCSSFPSALGFEEMICSSAALRHFCNEPAKSVY